MAHYAFIDDSGIVTEVITGKDENDSTPEGFDSWEAYYLTKRPEADDCKRTSYNTLANAHRDGGDAFRGNYAGVGFTYDSVNDVFYAPRPYPSWSLDSNWTWQPPIDYPGGYEGDGNNYTWDEDVYQADTSNPKTAGWVSA
tara:strand:- start:394 stop:816 length:423 start_codon:yes stop_codon:yes gene_type:complete